MRHERTQWNIGQGGFHTASVLSSTRDSDPLFRYVYDCGSLSSGHPDAAIAEYVTSAGSAKNVDAIFLSHIDADHVNGLPRLLDTHGVEAEFIFLPLLSPAQRLLAASQGEEKVSDFMVNIAADPSSALREFTSANVVQIQPGEGPSDAGDGRELQRIGGDDGEPRASIVGKTGDWIPDGNSNYRLKDDAGIRVETGSGEPHWLLSFYLEREALDKSDAFLKLLARRLGEDPITWPDQIDQATVRSLLTDTPSLKVLRKVYADVGVDVNRGSFMLLSGPSWGTPCENIRLGTMTAHLGTATWLLTGDAKLDTEAAVVSMREHLGPRIQQTGVIALPHHGSGVNFHSSILDVGDSVHLAFAAAGESHRHWAHPHPSVIKSVTSAGVTPWVVTEGLNSKLVAEARVHGR
ncbi:hypothetical protein A20C1_09539 [marine actinobacterium PHSC20C1]|nr:hypothetical protein A20C1_09539 [marine actinobacterium PHSC20C1]